MAYKETRVRLEELLNNKNALAAELSDAGTDSPPTDSLPDLTADAREVVAPKGVKKRYIVSGSARLCRGEFAERVLEYVSVSDGLRFALGDVHLLDTAELGGGRVGVVFSQENQVKFKIISAENNEILLGNTVILNEKRGTDYARLAVLSQDCLLAVYAVEGVGVADKITLNGRVSGKVWSDVWDTDNPENICAAPLKDCLLLTATHGCGGEITAVCVTENGQNGGLSVGNEVKLLLDCDGDGYADGWAICPVEDNIAALCYPRGDGQSLGLTVLDVFDDGAGGWRASARYEGNLTYKGALPTAGCVSTGDGHFLVAYGVSYQDKTADLAKSAVAVEEWGLTRYAAERLNYGCDNARLSEPVGGVRVRTSGVGVAVSFCNGETGRCLWIATAEGVVPAPAVPLGTQNGFCEMVPISQQRAILVVQKGGNSYATLYRLAERVIPATGGGACGIALSGGEAGEAVTVVEMGI